MGRLVRDPEMKKTQSGLSVAQFTLAVNRRFAKEGQQQADFISCIAWRQTAEFICKYFKKGAMLAAVGEIQTRSWDSDDGQRHYATEVLVNEAYFTGGKKTENAAPAQDALPAFDDFEPEDMSGDDLPF